MINGVNVRVVSCAGAHDGQAVGRLIVPAAAAPAAYPGPDALLAYAIAPCQAGLAAYVPGGQVSPRGFARWESKESIAKKNHGDRARKDFSRENNPRCASIFTQPVGTRNE